MLKDEYSDKLEALNKELAAAPVGKFDGHKVVVSGIIYNMPGILKALDDNKLAIAADAVSYTHLPTCSPKDSASSQGNLEDDQPTGSPASLASLNSR